MNNIFENAYFGKAYKTRDGRKMIYLIPCPGGEMHKLLDEDINIEHLHKNGQYAKLYPLPCDIVSEWQEPVDEEELNKLALKEYAEWALPLKEDEYILDEHTKMQIEAFKVGYRKS